MQRSAFLAGGAAVAAVRPRALRAQTISVADLVDRFPGIIGIYCRTLTPAPPLVEVRSHEIFPAASIIKLADKTSNLRAIAKSPPPWPIDRKRTYVEWARAVVSGLPFKQAGLLAKFEEAVELAMESIERNG